MAKPDYFRAQAKACLRLANETTDAATAQSLRVMAADFVAKAAEMEQRVERVRAVPTLWPEDHNRE